MNVGQIFDEARDRALTDNIERPDEAMLRILNSRIRELNGIARWPWLRRERAFSSVSGQFVNILPFEDVRDIEYIRRPNEPRQRLTRIDTQVFFGAHPEAGAGSQISGSPANYVPMGWAPVTTQPSSTGQSLEVVSSDASDTTQKVQLDVMVGGYEQRYEVELAGTNPKAVGAGALITEVLAYSKSTYTTGRITLRVTPNSTVLATLAPGLVSTTFPRIGLDPLPSAVESFTVGLFRRTIDLTSLYDVPYGMPEERHNILLYGVTADLLAFEEDDSGYGKFEGKWVAGVNAMLEDSFNPQDKQSEIRVSGVLMRNRAIRLRGGGGVVSNRSSDQGL